ncbi:MAG: S9 family peptidase [Candidatus Sumerlaeia bacterium]|nr:S9 family peptidase [Candidatus Sumerlaeia bacterium]
MLAGCGHIFRTSPGTTASKDDQLMALEKIPLIPREIIFGNPDRAAVRLSPDGRHITFLAPLNDVLNIWIAPADDPDAAEPLTRDDGRGIRIYFWAFTNEHVLYLQDREGDENWRVYSVNVKSRETTDLTPLHGVRAQIQAVSRHFPDELLIGLNDRDPSYHDIHRVNLHTGERELVLENEGYSGFIVDDQFNVRFGHLYNQDGSYQYRIMEEDGSWADFMTVPPEDTFNTSISGFDKDATSIYLVESRNRITSALTLYNLETGEQTLLAEDERADLDGTLRHPTERHVQAAAFEYDRVSWQILDEDIRPDLEALAKVDPGELQVTSRTIDDRRWIVAFTVDNGPLRYYLWDRDNQKGTFLFTNRSVLEGLPFASMRPVVIPSRDGLNLVSYLTLPLHAELNEDGWPTTPLPMVLHVHGGPWARDSWGYNATHQFLANRGYAVLSVNFRGSTGFGKDFLNAGKREWGAAMHDDLVDAVNWAVDKNIADPDRVAIMGGSYGGYAALAGLTFTPDLFAAAISVVGPSNLITLLESVPPYWAPAQVMFRERVGDHTTEEGRAFLESRSPLTHVDNIRRPLLIGQGANDPRVKQAESDQIVEAMGERGIPVTYALYPDEGHGFARPENRISFNAVTEAFLSVNLGGRFEPVGDAFKGATITVPSGADDVPGLREALEARTD